MIPVKLVHQINTPEQRRPANTVKAKATFSIVSPISFCGYEIYLFFLGGIIYIQDGRLKSISGQLSFFFLHCFNVNEAAALITVVMANKHNGLLTQPGSEEGEGMSNFCVIKAI